MDNENHNLEYPCRRLDWLYDRRLHVLSAYTHYKIKALKAYINSKQVREEKAQSAKSLGEVLKAHRTNCKMTQEFIAEHLGISRQAVSKWESGASDPSTSNLIALAKLFEISPEDLLKEAQQ